MGMGHPHKRKDYKQQKGPAKGPLERGMLFLRKELSGTRGLELFEELAGRAGDINSARGSALTILHALDDAGRLGALWAIGALVGIHDLLTVAGLGNLCHNLALPGTNISARALGTSNALSLENMEDVRNFSGLSGLNLGRNRRRRTAVVAQVILQRRRAYGYGLDVVLSIIFPKLLVGPISFYASGVVLLLSHAA
jgi:hypothetical protein